VKLHDAGIRASLEIVDPARFRSRLASGENDVALVRVPVLAMRPALAAAQVAFAVRGAAAARRAMAALSGLPPEAALAAADRLGRDLAIVPLVASGWRVSLAPRVQGFAARADGSFDMGDLWLLGGTGP
jgi:peptide/nickel transport system substrate-binding protein